MMPENTWRRVRSSSDPETGERVVLLSGVFEGVRLWCEKHWSKPHHESGERSLLHERFMYDDPHDPQSGTGAWRTAEEALAYARKHAHDKNELAQLDPERIP